MPHDPYRRTGLRDRLWQAAAFHPVQAWGFRQSAGPAKARKEPVDPGPRGAQRTNRRRRKRRAPKVSKRQAIIKQLVNRSAQGDLKALQMLLGIMQDIEQRSAAAAVEPTFDAADEKVLEQLKSRLGTDQVFNDRKPDPGRIRHPATAGLRHLRGALLSRSEPANRAGDQLAYRDHRRQARRGAPGQDPTADHQPAAAPSQILADLDRVSGVVFGPRPIGADPLRQLCPGSRRQARARLPRDHDRPVVSADLPDPARRPAPGGAGVCDHPPGLSPRHLEWRRADRARRRHHPDRRSPQTRGGIVRHPTASRQ